MTDSRWFLVALVVAAVLFGLGFAAGGSLGEVALVWVVPLALLALLAVARRR